MTLRNDEIAVLTQKARAAQRERRWAEAETAWREILSERPLDHAARAGLGTLFLSVGRIAEAREIGNALLADAPREIGALTLAARVSAATEDWVTAAAYWRGVLAIKVDAAAAVTGLGNALLGSRDFGGAETFATKLEEQFPTQPWGGVLSARVASARGDVEGAIQLLRENAEAFPTELSIKRDLCHALLGTGKIDDAEIQANAIVAADREEGLTQLGNVLARRAPDADHTDFWKNARAEFPGNRTFLRREAMQALKAGRSSEAIAAMDALLTGGEVSLNDAGLVVGLAHVRAARGDVKRLRDAIRTYLRRLRRTPDYHLAALRLSRLIFAHFAKAESRRRISTRERTVRMIRRAPLKPKPCALLERSIALEERLANEAPTLLDTDVSRTECLAFVAHVRDRVARREPFSFVRVNDGEANALPYEADFAAHFDSDAAEREQVWWQRTIDVAERRAMTAKVAEAIWNADAIGLPTLGRILRDVHLNADDDFTQRRTGRGLVAGVAAFERWRTFRPASLPPPLFTSANLQQDLQRWTVYGELFDGIGDIVLVTCHPNLPDVMKQAFNVGTAAFIAVPPGDASIHLRPKDDTRVLPDVLDDVVAKVEAIASDRVVVVGAGYLGKWIVHRAKAAGGIALDLGSALDYWVGLKTRSYQDLA